MEKMLLMRVHLLDDRYHGEGDWPPSPARLFQALVAGNAFGAKLPDTCAEALRWLEAEAGPPEICAQRGWLGLRYTTFVPNNDLDAKGGDPREVSSIRVGKSICPRHIDARKPILYSWRFEANDQVLDYAGRICEMADNLYQLGRGVDSAWAVAELLDIEEGKAQVDSALGENYRPSKGPAATSMDCPQPGSLDSLLMRFRSNRERFSVVKKGRKTEVLFTNPPKPRFQRIPYNSSPQWRLFDLRIDREGSPFRSWPQARAVSLVEQARDAAAERLSQAMPEQKVTIERFLIGRNATAADKARRVRLVPLPSIGHTQTNRSIRRLLVMVPSECPLSVSDVDWAFSGLTFEDGRVDKTLLVSADDPSMLRNYALESGESYRVWRSVTPVALPHGAARRRIDPLQRSEQAKLGSERMAEQQRACAAVVQALRHVEIQMPVESIHVQREPFSPKGLRAEIFAEGTRFSKERLWHVELQFAAPLEGPLVIGDGRYLGLGVFAPVHEAVGVLAYRINGGLSDAATAEALAQALRRAMMARVQHRLGENIALPPFFTGHASDGSPLRGGQHRHLTFAADLPRRRLLIVAPHVLEGRKPWRDEQIHLGLLDEAMQNLSVLRAGRSGSLNLSALSFDPDEDCLFGCFKRWESVTGYRPTRYAKRLSPVEVLEADVLREVDRRGLPRPHVEVLSVEAGPRGGLEGRVRLEFQSAEAGPIILGKTCHLGGGLFSGF